MLKTDLLSVLFLSLALNGFSAEIAPIAIKAFEIEIVVNNDQGDSARLGAEQQTTEGQLSFGLFCQNGAVYIHDLVKNRIIRLRNDLEIDAIEPFVTDYKRSSLSVLFGRRVLIIENSMFVAFVEKNRAIVFDPQESPVLSDAFGYDQNGNQKERIETVAFIDEHVLVGNPSRLFLLSIGPGRDLSVVGFDQLKHWIASRNDLAYRNGILYYDGWPAAFWYNDWWKLYYRDRKSSIVDSLHSCFHVAYFGKNMIVWSSNSSFVAADREGLLLAKADQFTFQGAKVFYVSNIDDQRALFRRRTFNADGTLQGVTLYVANWPVP